MHHRSAGIEAHQVLLELLAGQPVDLTNQRTDIGQNATFVALAMGGGVGAAQPGIVGYQAKLVGQQAALGQQALRIQRHLATQRQGALGAPLAAFYRQCRVGLLHGCGLAQPGLVEAQEVAGLGLQVQAAALDGRIGLQHGLGQGLELGLLGIQVVFPFYAVHAVHAAPPNTSMSRNLQAGAAWPTRITCEGSPLPQKGVPITSKVSASPTIASERQNVALMPR